MRAWVAIFALFVVAHSGQVVAADAASQTPDPLAAAPADVTRDFVEGEVASVNVRCQTLRVEAPDGAHDLLIREQTEVFLERERVADLTKLPPGYIARAYFRSNGDAARILVVQDPASLPAN